MNKNVNLRQSIDLAISFLKDRLIAGRCGLACFGSDGTPRFSHDKGHVFTGFFIAEALAGCLTEQERTLLLARILSEENGGLWGYSPPAPFIGVNEVFIVDADDTAYVLRTLRRLNFNRSPSCLLAFHREVAKLFSTFNVAGVTRLARHPSAANNLLAHPEVNANVYHALRGTNLERYINYGLVREAQADDGHWPSYFYPGPFFGTALYLDLVRDLAPLEDARRRGIDYLMHTQNGDGSWGAAEDAYDTALALNALAACREVGPPFQKGIAKLMVLMHADGSWRSDRVIWEFHADASDVWRARDMHGTLVSALCTLALRRCAGDWPLS